MLFDFTLHYLETPFSKHTSRVASLSRARQLFKSSQRKKRLPMGIKIALLLSQPYILLSLQKEKKPQQGEKWGEGWRNLRDDVGDSNRQ